MYPSPGQKRAKSCTALPEGYGYAKVAHRFTPFTAALILFWINYLDSV